MRKSADGNCCNIVADHPSLFFTKRRLNGNSVFVVWLGFTGARKNENTTVQLACFGKNNYRARFPKFRRFRIVRKTAPINLPEICLIFGADLMAGDFLGGFIDIFAA